MPRIPIDFNDDIYDQELRDYTSRLPVQLPENLITSQTGEVVSKSIANLFGSVGDTPRYQTWPEQLVRSGTTLPRDVVTGEVPTRLGLRREDFTDIPDERKTSDTWLGGRLRLREGSELGPSSQLIERTQDLSGMAGGGSVAGIGGEASLASSGMRKYPLASRDNWYGEANFEKTGGRMQNMTPDEFLSQGRPLKIDEISRENINDLKQHILDGKELDPLQLYKNGKEDGRHRAVAAKELGIDEVPVITFRSDSAQSGAPLAALERAPRFYSALEHAVNNSKTKVANADQWLGELRNQPGVKAEELDWVLHDLPTGKITKSELEQFINEHKVELKEVNKSTQDVPKYEVVSDFKDEDGHHLKIKSSSGKIYEADNDSGHYQVLEMHPDKPGTVAANLNVYGGSRPETLAEIRNLIRQHEQGDNFSGDVANGPRHSQWQLPGGKNYREMIMTLPESMGNPQSMKSFDAFNEQLRNKYDINFDSPYDVGKIATREEAIKYGQLLEQAQKDLIKNNNYTHSHWPGIVNPVAHVRMNDRQIPQPGFVIQNTRSGNKSSVFATEAEARTFQQSLPESVRDSTKLIVGDKPLNSLHIEEGQSDLHQAGRHQGYVGEKEKLQPQFDKIEQKILDSGDDAIMANPELKDALKVAVEKKIITADEARTYQRYSDINSQQLAGNKPVMDAPFKKDATVDLLLKRMIRQAAEENRDAISWTPGQAQADRYDLSKQVGEIYYNKTKQILYAYDHDGKNVMAQNAKPSEIENHIGKDVAKKLLDENNKEIKNKPRFGEEEQIEGYRLKGQDLKVGGEFHKKLYDEVWVNKANAIVKKFGGKVEQQNLTTPVKKGSEEWYALSPAERQKIENQNQSIHVLRITPQLRDAALHKGFSLFTDTGKVGAPLAALTKVEHNPFKLGELEKQHNVKLTPVTENPFTTDAYHGGPHSFQGDAIRPKTKYDLRDVGDGNKRYYDIIYQKFVGPKFKDEVKALDWAAKKGLSEFYSTPNSNLAGDYAMVHANDPSSHVMPLKLDTRDYFRVNAKGQTWDAVNDMAIYEANQQGKKGITIYNVRDDANPRTNERGPQTIHITLDPSTVRSKFAKFDPAKFGESGLLKASGLPVYSDDKGNQLIPPPPNPARIAALEPPEAAIKTIAVKAGEWGLFALARNSPRLFATLNAAWGAQLPIMINEFMMDDIRKQVREGKSIADIKFEEGSLGDMFGAFSALERKYGKAASRLRPISGNPFDAENSR